MILYLKGWVWIHQSDTIAQTIDQGSGRPAAPAISELKWLFLSVECGGFDKSIDGKL